MGTLHYLAPEQLHGTAPDVRSDIFAFGLLAYEMLSGRRAFEGETHAGVIAAILKDDPQALDELVPRVPPALIGTIKRCLAKDPDDRWQTANDLRFRLSEIANSPADVALVPSPNGRSRRMKPGLWGVVVTAAVAAVALLLWTGRPNEGATGTAAVANTIRFSVQPPARTTFAVGFDVPFALAPDGRHLVFVATDSDGTNALWLHSFGSERQQRLAGTEGATTAFWSPDAEWVGFFAGRTLRKLRISTG